MTQRQPFTSVSYGDGRLLTKVPEMTVYFWIIKLLTTAMGEATSDFVVLHLNPFIAVVLGLLAMIATLVLQFRVRRYIAWVYWLVVAMVSVFGTMAADAIHIVLHVPYFASTAFFLVVLAIIFVLWYRSEKTLSIHSIYTAKRETFYWATVLATFALGTAAGDMTATTFHLGYFSSGILFSVLFILPAIGYGLFRLNGVFAFWFAYIMTRPVGASFADWFGVDRGSGGLGYGRGHVSGVLIVCIIALVWYLSVARRDVRTEFSRFSGRD